LLRSPQLREFLSRCVVKDQKKRPYAHELQQHPWLVGGENKTPIRDLLKLADAEIEEVLEDLSEEEIKKLEEKNQIDLENSNQEELTGFEHIDANASSTLAITPTMFKTPSRPNTGADSQGSASASRDVSASSSSRPNITVSSPITIQSPAKAPQAAFDPKRASASSSAPHPYLLSAHKSSPLVPATAAAHNMSSSAALIQSALNPLESTPPNDGDEKKKFKTLTRTRKYINEDGETVTIKTQRIVETSAASGKVSTLKRGGSRQGSDWVHHDQAKLALFRKQQLREMKIIQHDEQKECSELILRLKVERDQCVCDFVL
jgi:serine/threonine-protein kinase 10